MNDDEWDDDGGMTLNVRYENLSVSITGSVNWTPELCDGYLTRMCVHVRGLNAGLVADAIAANTANDQA